MKNFNLFALVASLTLVFSSCSTNETILPEEQSVDLLKTYTVKRDATGVYSIDYNLNSNATSESVLDDNTNTKNIYLYSSDNQSSRKVTQDLTIDGTQLKVGFIDTNTDKSHNITISDDNLTVARKTDNKKLKDYSISSNLDGTYTLDFAVNNKVKVDFVFNEEANIYEIHLEEGKGGETNFSRVLEKEAGEPLKFDFVNHISNVQAKGTSEVLLIRKPQGIII
ncbi:hypothetical protein [Polaribacter sp. Z022]|uniref:hypothetical protein n=1 Tax=Polaribacter sp. Z022 TaxID=2927125 RepID=UPI0020207C13|nr:hypothetical protein [Polaribacter sp. Z022]MCL7753944.1 hypothetical protein [Polaribacter sp. Z022]